MATALRAVFFDLDGLLVDTEPTYYEAHRSVFAERGVALTREEYARRWIIRGERTARIAPEKGIDADPALLSAEATRRFREMIEREVNLMPGARDAVERASRRFVTALVTNTPRPVVDGILARTGLVRGLHHLVTRETYDRPKPAPDCYLAAALVARVPRVDALALEDSPRGAGAAVAAGVRCVWVPNVDTVLEGPPPGIWRTVRSLADLDFDGLARDWPGPVSGGGG